MKNLIKLSIVAFGLTIGAIVHAQSFGIKAGLNIANQLMIDDDRVISNNFKMNPGFNVGATVEFPLSSIFSLETGLLLSTKGYKTYKETVVLGQTFTYDSKINLLYLDIPLTAKASADVGSVKIFGIFGPYIGVGLNGKTKTKVTGLGNVNEEEKIIRWGSDDDRHDYRSLDFGLTMTAGVEIKSVQIMLSYGHGLANIAPKDYDDDDLDDFDDIIRNRVIGISIGYKFGGK
ncbi:MAG: porin family protein [Bacteroidales bacterium]|nr:porin family protein [Bacteroidales bacterium]MDY0215677.1 porin family protein [Bacteroidales bacterium]